MFRPCWIIKCWGFFITGVQSGWILRAIVSPPHVGWVHTGWTMSCCFLTTGSWVVMLVFSGWIMMTLVVFLSQGLQLVQWPVCLHSHGSHDLAGGQRRRNHSNLLTSLLLLQSLNLCSSVIWLARQLDLTSWPTGLVGYNTFIYFIRQSVPNIGGKTSVMKTIIFILVNYVSITVLEDFLRVKRLNTYIGPGKQSG